MTITVDKEWRLYESKHLIIDCNFPRRYGIFPPWFSFGISLDFQKWHIVIFFWKYIITLGKTVTWGRHDFDE